MNKYLFHYHDYYILWYKLNKKYFLSVANMSHGRCGGMADTSYGRHGSIRVASWSCLESTALIPTYKISQEYVFFIFLIFLLKKCF